MYCHKAVETVREKSSQRGFTLVEVLIALAIFSLGMLAVGTLQINSTNSNASARIHTEEYTWVVDQIERMMALGYDDADLTAGDHSVVQGPYTVSWTVTDDAPAPDAKRIAVTADGSHSRARPITIEFIKAR
jgi:prepilin-type N-terminal cleavage/methylation domain-containing protein